MDLAEARRLIPETPEALPDVLLAMFDLFTALDQEIAEERRKREDLERTLTTLRERLGFAGEGTES